MTTLEQNNFWSHNQCRFLQKEPIGTIKFRTLVFWFNGGVDRNANAIILISMLRYMKVWKNLWSHGLKISKFNRKSVDDLSLKCSGMSHQGCALRLQVSIEARATRDFDSTRHTCACTHLFNQETRIKPVADHHSAHQIQSPCSATPLFSLFLNLNFQWWYFFFFLFYFINVAPGYWPPFNAVGIRAKQRLDLCEDLKWVIFGLRQAT